MEIFDLVNENDEVIGNTDKETAHSNGDLHRIVAIFVFASNGDLYVQEHKGSNNALDHSVGGHVSQGESYDDAAKREAEEELGITDDLSYITIFYSDERYTGANRRHMIGLYECHVNSTWQFVPNEEVEKIIAMPIETIVEEMNQYPEKFTGGFKTTMFEYIKSKNLPYNLKNYQKS